MTDELSRDIFFMRAAIAEAQKALSQGEVPIGAVVVAAGRIVARGHNLVETLGDPTAHAEMQALTAAAAAAGKYLNECTVYVTVEPCPMCAAAMYWAQTGAVVYGADDPKRGFTTISPALLHPKTVVRRGILAAECAEMMTAFFREKRN